MLNMDKTFDEGKELIVEDAELTGEDLVRRTKNNYYDWKGSMNRVAYVHALFTVNCCRKVDAA